MHSVNPVSGPTVEDFENAASAAKSVRFIYRKHCDPFFGFYYLVIFEGEVAINVLICNVIDAANLLLKTRLVLSPQFYY